MLAMEAGGADIIELGVPFSDPVADGAAIQKTNAVSSVNISRQKSSSSDISPRLRWSIKSTTRPFLVS
jgi:tryptophan synthase alpha subunit